MKVLGIHVGHDSSAALVVDGRIVADAAEERFGRSKHCAGLPRRAIDFCLKRALATEGPIDAIAVSTARPVPQLSQWLAARVDGPADAGLATSVGERARRLLAAPALEPPLYLRETRLSQVPVLPVPHHLAHAASAYYTCGSRRKQLVVTMDGSGDGCSTALWRGEHGRLEPLLELGESASLGWFYGCVTEALGWWHGDGEGKTMGLAAFGDHGGPARGSLDRFHPRFAGGQLVEPHDFGRPSYWNEAGALHWHLREAVEVRRLIEEHGREAVAAEAQRVLEEQVCALVLPWLEREGVDEIACAGGVFLNVKLNQRLWETGRLARQHIFPNAGDGGLAAGAALQVHFRLQPREEIPALGGMDLGPEYTDQEVERCLEVRRLAYRRADDPAEEAARLLAEGAVIGWFQGRMESGPRALGNRSILMGAADPRNRDVLNARVKFRESFRPYCPSLLEESRDLYLEGARVEAFMTTSFRATREAAARVPAAVHVDETVRPQMVNQEADPRFWRLLSRFAELTGESLLLNTSFNLAGEPLVNSPSDAIRCFFDSGLDALVLHDFVLRK